MHPAVPRCSDCEEPIRRFVASFSGASVAEEVVACGCSAVTVSYVPPAERDPPDDSIPDAWG
jgi:glycerol-3-phosphate dehydrogenase